MGSVVVTAVTLPETVETTSSGSEASRAADKGLQYVFRSGDLEMFRYQASAGPLPRADILEAYRRGGYLTSIHTPSGRLVSEDYPPSHLHHHGIWMTWTRTRFDGRSPDFWNMGKCKGRVDCLPEQVRLTTRGAGLVARHLHVDMLAEPEEMVLDETWQVTAHVMEGPPPLHLIDLVSTQACATGKPLHLTTYHYGGLGIRGREAWLGETNCLFLTSTGETNRLVANETRSKWCWMGGKVDGVIAGMTVLCHPSNFRFPQPIRVHPREPFLCFAPPQLGEFAIAPDSPYISRYRIIVADRMPSMEEATAWWEMYAAGEP